MIAINEEFASLPISADNKALLIEAMTEFEIDQRNEVKKIIKERLLEIKRLEFMVEKAKADLAKLMAQDQESITMLGGR
jgi:hypothetical protein